MRVYNLEEIDRRVANVMKLSFLCVAVRQRPASCFSASLFRRANASSQNVSSMDLSSVKPSRRRRYRRLVPLRLSVSNPAFLSTRRCWDIAERVVLKLSAICPARISRLRMSRRMATRRGSARARNIEAVCRENLAISTCSILSRTALTLVRTNDRVNCS